jgi:cytochrome c-type biogenesis protein CcmH
LGIAAAGGNSQRTSFIPIIFPEWRMMIMMRNKLLFLLLLACGFLAVSSRPAAAQDPQPTPSDNEVNRIAKQMFCPVCENIPLDVCPTQACSEWRELIRLKISEGWSDEQIKQYFATQYGDRVLAEPPRRGLNWLVYVLPGAFFAVGVYILFRVLGGMQRKGAAGAAARMPAASSPGAETPVLRDEAKYLKELEDELRKSS